MKFRSLRAALQVPLLAVMFAGGFAFHKYQFFPYQQIGGLAKSLKREKGKSVDTKEAILSQYSKKSNQGDLLMELDTTLLPLKVNGFSVSKYFDFPKGAGAITIVNDTIILIDRLGEIYSYQNKRFEKVNFPKIPANLENYISESGFALTSDTFRVHDIEYVPFASALAVSHEYFDKLAKGTRLAVSIIKVDKQTIEPLGTWKTIFLGDLLAAPTYAGSGGGGRLVSKVPDKLYVTAGDYNQDGVMIESSHVSQDPKSTFGKIIEINLQSGKHRIVSGGHRNPQGLLIDNNGELLSTEHGPAGGDELNRIADGANFGWPNVTLGTDYVAYDWPNTEFAGEHQGYQLPVFAWLPSIAVGNLIQVKGFHRRWDGDMLVASLKATSLFRIRMVNYRVIYSEPIWIGERIRDLAQLSDGTIVLWTDDAKLLFVTIDHVKLLENKRPFQLLSPVLYKCMSCHHFGITDPSHLAPTLSGLIGKKIGSDNFERYSTGLKALTGDWTRESLKAFISNPAEFASGTTMPVLDLTEEDVERILHALE